MPHQKQILDKVEELERYEKSWRVDKHIPVALLFAIVLQLCGFIWYASKLDSSVGENTKAVQVNAARIALLEQSQVKPKDIEIMRQLVSADVRAEVAGITAQLNGLRETITELKGKR